MTALIFLLYNRPKLGYLMIKIIVGHDGMDLDSLGSVILAGCLYPDFVCIKNRLVHPLAANVCNSYQEHLNLISIKELKGQEIDELLIVDTREKDRVKEIFHAIGHDIGKITVIDHHVNAKLTIEADELISHDYGSNTTYFALELKKKNFSISPEIATIGLLGIYADTGSFSHESVREADFEAASYLLSQGASIALVKHFLKVPPLNVLEDCLQMAIKSLSRRVILGHQIGFFLLDIPHIPGLATIVDRIFEVESLEAIFAIFAFRDKNQMLIIARSKAGSIDVNHILATYGGGGHTHSASATLKATYNLQMIDELTEHLRRVMIPAVCARDIMKKPECIIEDTCSLYDASIYLENMKSVSTSVINQEGKFVGILDLSQISQARKHGKMQDSVRNHCEKDPVFCRPQALLHEIENIFFTSTMAKIPVVDETGLLCGVIPRVAYLEFLQKIHSDNITGEEIS